MTDKGKDLSIQIMEALKPILPKNVGFIMIVGEYGDENVGVTSNIPDDVALDFLKAATASILTEPAVDLENEVN
jgi:hypothetical protein